MVVKKMLAPVVVKRELLARAEAPGSVGQAAETDPPDERRPRLITARSIHTSKPSGDTRITNRSEATSAMPTPACRLPGRHSPFASLRACPAIEPHTPAQDELRASAPPSCGIPRSAWAMRKPVTRRSDARMSSVASVSDLTNETLAVARKP